MYPFVQSRPVHRPHPQTQQDVSKDDLVPQPLRIAKKRTISSTLNSTLRRTSALIESISSRRVSTGPSVVPKRLSSLKSSHKSDPSTNGTASQSEQSILSSISALSNKALSKGKDTLHIKKQRPSNAASTLVVGLSASEGIPRRNPNTIIIPHRSSQQTTTTKSHENHDDENTPPTTQASSRPVTVKARVEPKPFNRVSLWPLPSEQLAGVPTVQPTLRRPTWVGAGPSAPTKKPAHVSFSLPAAETASPGSENQEQPQPTFNNSTNLNDAPPPLHHLRHPSHHSSGPIILSAGVKIIPELEGIVDDGGQSIWVAVEVSGELDKSKVQERLQSNPTMSGLDIVVVIDNS